MPTERHTRRSFLQGKAAVSAISNGEGVHTHNDGAHAAPGDSHLGGAGRWMPAESHPAPLVKIRRRAMACDWEVQLAADRDDDSMEYIFQALDLVESLESQLTVYRDTSEMAAINRRAAEEPVVVEPRLFGLFELAARIHAETHGAYDITSGPLSRIWGFSRREGRIPAEVEIAAVLATVGMNHVELDPANFTVRYRLPGLTLNLNSIGKGYALDRMEELLAAGGVDDYLLHGGKSSVLARGDCPGREERGWSIGLRHPLHPRERIAEFYLVDEALSTSGSGTQFFTRRGRRYGHILDPRTGWPVDGIYSATVLAPTGAEAEALSTAFYVMGPKAAGEYCANHPRIGAVLVTPGDRSASIEVHAFNLDGDRWRSLSPASV